MRDEKGYLPIGSVVLLDKTPKKIIVIGIAQVFEQGDDVFEFDYVGVPFPEGFLGLERTVVFQKSDITDVVFRGYENKEYQVLMERIETLKNQ